MNNALRQEGEILLTGLLFALLVGFFAGNILLWLLIALAFYAGWNLYNLARLARWLSNPGKHTPEVIGIWDEIYYQLYQLYMRQRKAKRKLSSILTRFQESTQALPYATIVLNKDKEIEWFNNAAKRMFDLRSGYDVGQRIDNLIRLPKFTQYLNKNKFDNPIEFEFKENNVMVTMTPYGNGQFLLGGHDVTQRHKLDDMRKHFIANASHELRTPLTVIAGYLEAVQEIADEGMKVPLERIQEQTERMQKLLEELISLSKLETSEVSDDLDDIFLPDLLEDIYKEAREYDLDRHQIVLETEELTIPGDREELRVAFSNLVTNAIRYSAEGTVIRLYCKTKDIATVVGVEDQGVGISAEHRHRLTERFYRVDPGRSREQGGTGLGLAIVKHILDRHDARLLIKSEPGKGSTFECQFNR
jgi:two-component system phosphate regulon sensor histidine kinase PhoR